MWFFEKNEKWSSSKNLLPLDPKVYVTIVDVGMIWQIFAPTWGDWEKAVAMIYPCVNCFTMIISVIISRHQLATEIIIVNDPCNFLCSIKDEERDRQKQGN